MAELKEECGVFGIFNNKDSAALTALGLHALQHRGQEGCGIVTFDEKNFFWSKNPKNPQKMAIFGHFLAFFKKKSVINFFDPLKIFFNWLDYGGKVP